MEHFLKVWGTVICTFVWLLILTRSGVLDTEHHPLYFPILILLPVMIIAWNVIVNLYISRKREAEQEQKKKQEQHEE